MYYVKASQNVLMHGNSEFENLKLPSLEYSITCSLDFHKGLSFPLLNIIYHNGCCVQVGADEISA